MRSFARLLQLGGALALALAVPGTAGAALHQAPPEQRVPEPAVGSGRLVKQVPGGRGDHKGKAATAAGSAARSAPPAPALLARSKREGQAEARPRAPAIEMVHITSHATFDLQPDLRGGGFSSKQLQRLSWFMRCHYTNRRKPMDPHLISLLYATARHYHNAKITVISGYRSPQVALAKGNPKSPHKRGVACDFRLDGVDLSELRDYLRGAYNGVGVGYYPNSGFVHLDVGRKQSAFWIDYSGPGQRARYSDTPEADLRDGTATRGGPPETTALPPAPVPAEDDDAQKGGDEDQAKAAKAAAPGASL